MGTIVDNINYIYDAVFSIFFVGAMVVFVAIYFVISYLSGETTSNYENMGIPVEYAGMHFAGYVANFLVSIPLTIIIIWLILHLVKVLFGLDLIIYIKHFFTDLPIAKFIEIVDTGIVNAEVKTAHFIHSKLDTTTQVPTPYRG